MLSKEIDEQKLHCMEYRMDINERDNDIECLRNAIKNSPTYKFGCAENKRVLLTGNHPEYFSYHCVKRKNNNTGR